MSSTDKSESRQAGWANPLDGLREGDWLSLDRLKHWTLVFAAVFLALAGFDFWRHTSHGVVDGHGEQIGRDFVNYWAGARLAIEGRASNAYDIQHFLDYERSLTAPNAEVKWYGYPPVAMVLSAPLGFAPFLTAFAGWTLLGWAILTRLLVPKMGLFWAVVAWMATPAFFLNVIAGQNGAFSAAILAGGLLLLPRRPVFAGLLFGLLCYKPHLGVLIPFAMAATGRWQAILAAGASVALLICTSLFFVGWQPWVGFIHNSHIHSMILEIEKSNWVRMPSVYVGLRLAGISAVWAYIGQALSAICAAASIVWIYRGGSSERLKAAAFLIGTFLVSPYAWDYDLVVLLFAAVWLWEEAEATEWRPWEKTSLFLLVAFPVMLPFVGRFAHLSFGPLILWLVLGLIVARIRTSSALSWPTDPTKLVVILRREHEI